ncbi:hypothetical protein MMC11_005445 [Xylographa trunciseda]|nr:hypothetical protein [Xylographa trunciseda]
MNTSVMSAAPPRIIAGANMATAYTAAGRPSTIAIRRPITARKNHVWTALQLVHAVILKQYSGFGNTTIASLLNAHFSTNMSSRPVGHKCKLEAGTVTAGEAERRTDQGQLTSSALWNKVREHGETSLEVGFVLFTHKLLDESEWTRRTTKYRESQMGLELDTDAMMERLVLLAVPNWTKNRTLGYKISRKKVAYDELNRLVRHSKDLAQQILSTLEELKTKNSPGKLESFVQALKETQRKDRLQKLAGELDKLQG